MRSIYVGNLAFGTTEQDVRSVFERYGTVDRVNLMVDKYTGHSKGFAFVDMPNDDETRKAISAVNGIDIKGRTVAVNEAHAKTERSSGGAGGRRPDKKDRFGREAPRTPPKRQILT